jgi:hypothetical protein
MSNESMWLALPVAMAAGAAMALPSEGDPGAIVIIHAREFINSPADLWYAAPRDFCAAAIFGERGLTSLEESGHGPAC